MTTQNFFALLGDNENEDPAALVARYSSSAAAEDKPQPKKAQPVAKAQQPVASLPSKPLPPTEFVRESQRAVARGARGGGRGARGGFVERNPDRDDSNTRGGDNGLSGPRRNFNPDQADSNEARNSGYQGGRTGYRGGRVGYRGGGRAGSYGGYGDSPVGQEKEDGGREIEGGRVPARVRGRGRRGGYGRDEDDQGRDREYDRRSGTGRGYEIKREGAGRFNWGTETEPPPKDDLFEASPIKEDISDPQTEQKGDEQSKAEPTDNGPAAPQEEDDKEMTLDEYEKVLEEKRKALTALKSQERKVDVDKSFQNMQLMDKKSEDVFIKVNIDKEKGKKKEVLEKEDNKPKKAVSINEFLRPADGEAYYGMGNGRGRGRGFRGRGGSRGGVFSSSPVSAPRIEDPGQFPTLGAM